MGSIFLLAPMKHHYFALIVVAVYAFTIAGFYVSAIKTVVTFPDKDSYSWPSP